MPTEPPARAQETLGDPALRKSLQAFVRRRVPPAEVDDVVQTVLCEALAAKGRPGDPGELRRWLLGVARHKVVDFHRRAHREPPMELPEIEDEPAPIEARELCRWAEEQAGGSGDAQRTLGWMAREGEGDKLEAIAADEQLPPARVRQRVSRMRRWMKERWLAELAAVAALVTLALAAWWLLRRPSDEPVSQPEGPDTISPEPRTPLERARLLRAEGLEACAHGAYQVCLDDLDQARALDPEGDQAPAVGAARQRAERAVGPRPSSSGSKDDSEPPRQQKMAPSMEPVPTAAPRQKSAPPGKVRKGGKSKPSAQPDVGTGNGSDYSPKSSVKK